MTKEEKIIATTFTGKMFIDGSDMGLLYEYMEKKVGHGVIDLMLADKGFWEELHKACEQDFIDMVSKERPSLPDNLDEAAEKYSDKYCSDWAYRLEYEDAFIAGAEWQKEQMLKDAVEGEVEELYNDGESQCTVGVGTYFKPGDKVYVLKAEEE